MPVTYQMVNYRRFDVGGVNLNGATLETMCRSALEVSNLAGVKLWERAQDRLFNIADSDGRQILLNKVADLSSAVFGEMCLIQNQDLQALLELKPTKVKLSDLTMAEIYSLGERTAPTGSQFVRGLAYWMAIGNHFFFVKMQGLSPEYIHAYLDWLLKSCTSTIPNSVTFKLQAEFDPSQTGGDIGDIRSLRIRGKSAAPKRARVRRRPYVIEFQQIAALMREMKWHSCAENRVSIGHFAVLPFHLHIAISHIGDIIGKLTQLGARLGRAAPFDFHRSINCEIFIRSEALHQ